MYLSAKSHVMNILHLQRPDADTKTIQVQALQYTYVQGAYWRGHHSRSIS